MTQHRVKRCLQAEAAPHLAEYSAQAESGQRLAASCLQPEVEQLVAEYLGQAEQGQLLAGLCL